MSGDATKHDVPWPHGRSSLINLVQQRPMRHGQAVKCPFCGSTDLHEWDHYQTMLGGDPDPNHHWLQKGCRTCGRNFTYEHKDGFGWTTDIGGFRDGRRIIEGIASCFEPVEYNCAKCNGSVLREQRVLDGKILIECGETRRKYRTFWKCAGCGAEVETDE